MHLTLLLDPLARSQNQSARDRLLSRLGAQGRALPCDTPDALREAIETLRASGPTVVGVTGGDAGLSAVITALLAEGWPKGLRLLPLGGDSLVRDTLGIDGDPEAIVKRFVAASGSGFALRRPTLRDTPLRTLRAASSAHAQPLFGFVFGAGAFYRLADRARATPSSRLGAAALGFLGALRSEGAWNRVEARIALDRAPYAEGLRATAVTTLGRLPLGLKPFKGPAAPGLLNILWHDMNPAATAALAVPLSRGLAQNAQHKLGTARLVHIDMADGFVLDGALYAGEGAQVLSISAGPEVALVSV